MRNNEPIQDHAIQDRVNANITYDQSYSEIDACIAARLDVERWEMNGYPGWLKARVVAWHYLSGLIKVNADDAQNRAIQRASKNK